MVISIWVMKTHRESDVEVEGAVIVAGENVEEGTMDAERRIISNLQVAKLDRPQDEASRQQYTTLSSIVRQVRRMSDGLERGCAWMVL